MQIKEVVNFNNFIFSKLEIPDLLEYQKESFLNFINEKIPKLLDEISPIITPKAEVEFLIQFQSHQNFQLMSAKKEN